MRVQAEIFDISEGIITLRTNNLVDKLEVDKMYNVDFKRYYSSRSLEQNRLMWKIIQKLAKETDNDEWDIYIQGLEKADCLSEYLMILPEAFESIKQSFRAVKVCERRDYNGKQMLVVKVFVGSSKFDTQEMTELINYFIKLASEFGVYIGDL